MRKPKKKVIKYGSVYQVESGTDERVITDMMDTRKAAIEVANTTSPNYIGVCKVEWVEETDVNEWTILGHEVDDNAEKNFKFKICLNENPMVKDGVKNTGKVKDSAIVAIAKAYFPDTEKEAIDRLKKANGVTMIYTAARSPQIF